MAKQRTILRVMVGSPGDVSEERELLEESVRDVIIATSSTTQVHLELVRCETHTYPDFGSDPQDVINRQIDDDYDIFIGILWTRFGTPTGRANSGTEEEFLRAYERHSQNPKSVRIMIYFKTAPVSPDNLDPKQLQLIYEFRNKLGSLGGLYWKYSDAAEFGKLARLHLTQQVQQWGRSWGEATVPAAALAGSSSPTVAKLDNSSAPADVEEGLESEEGFLDLIETGSEKMDEFNACATRVTTAMMQLTKKISKRATGIAKFSSTGKPNMTRAKAIMEGTAKDMDDFVIATEADVAIFGNLISRSLDAYARSAVIASRFPGGQERLNNAINEIRAVLGKATEARDGMMVFRSSVDTIPPFTSSLIRSKKRVLSALDKLDAEFVKSINLLGSLDKMLSSADSDTSTS